MLRQHPIGRDPFWKLCRLLDAKSLPRLPRLALVTHGAVRVRCGHQDRGGKCASASLRALHPAIRSQTA
jgi:hypothetical protein